MEAFYDRKEEFKVLGDIERQSARNACFTVVTGRRRIGKTELLKKFMNGKKACYLFTSRSPEKNLCELWQKKLADDIGLKVFGQIQSVPELLEAVFQFSREEHFTLVIDEFQDLELVNKSVFSRIQDLWDSYKSSSRINLIACGSIYSMMTRIFKDNKEPLFGRATHFIHLKPFKTSVVKQILSDFSPKYTKEDLLCLYMFSGGVAKYIFLMMYAKAFTKKKMIDYAISMPSPFLTDGKDVLVSEIGKDYGTYFSILSLIAGGLTSQSEIDSVIGKNTGSYLQNLEKVFSVIKPVRPLLSKQGSRNARYQIVDAYQRFYFRFIYPHQDMIEFGQYDLLRDVVIRDYETFTGKTLEHYFAEKLTEEKTFTQIGGWWDKKSQNELDIITLDDIKKQCCVYEVKRQAKKLRPADLEQKAATFAQNIPGYKLTLTGLSMDDM